MSLLAQFLLPLRLGQCLPGHGDLLLIHVAEAFVIDHIVVGFHHRQADIGLHLLLLGTGDEHAGPRNLVVVHRLEAVKEVVAGAHGIVIMEGRRVEIRIGLRVDAAAKVVVRVRLRRNLRGKQRQGSVPSGNLRVARRGLLDTHLGRMGDGIGHAVPESHGSLAAGTDCRSKCQGYHYRLNEKVFHININVYTSSIGISCAKVVTC